MKRIVIIILAFSAVTFAQGSSTYEKGMEALSNGDTTKATEYLEQSAEDENFAPAYYELAKLEIKEDSWFSYDNARGYLQEAINLDSLNFDYRLLLGKVYELINKTGWFTQLLRANLNANEKAIETYENILRIDSTYAPAHLRLANIYEKEYYEYANSMSFIQFEHPEYAWNPTTAVDERADERAYNQYLNSLVIDGQYPSIYYDEKAKQFFNQSSGHYLRALDSGEINEELYFRYSLLLSSFGLKDSAVIMAERGVEKLPKSKQLALAAAYLNNKVKDYEKVQKYFDLAFSLMDYTEAADYKLNSVFALLTPEEKTAAANLDHKALENYIKIFWKKRDPLTVTDYNERELEHYSRMFYVNQYFSLPEKNIKGWKTDRGDIWIRYGEPKKLLSIKRDAEITGVDQPTLIGEMTVFPEAYVMTYDNGRIFSFIDEFNSKEYVHSEKSLSGRLGMQFFSDSKALSEDLKITEPEEYLLKVKANILDLPSSVVQLRDNSNKNSTSLYLSYAVPLKNDTTGFIPIRHIHDLSFMDNSFRTLAREKDTINYAKISTLNWFDGKKYVFSSSEIDAKPGTGFLSFEVLRPEDNGMYINHGRFDVKDFSGNKISMSDVIAAYDVVTSAGSAASIKRGHLYILPNPIKSFNKDKPPFLYYEVYNLQKNDKKLTDFEQDITIIEVPDEGFITSAWNSILNVVGIETENKISLKSNYNTLESDPQVYVQLDLMDYDPGKYLVTVKIKDNLSGEEVSSSLEITWQ